MRARSSRWVLGIDLGTTNTAAVALGPDGSEPVSILHGRNQPVMPSVVSLKNPRLPIVGWLAKDMMLTDPLTTIFGWKRFIGRTERSEYVSRHRARFPFQIHSDPSGALGAVAEGQVAPFEHIAALVLDQVRLQASGALRQDVRDCVISVPAHFANAQREAVLEAGRRARLNVLRLVNEPTAAALAFGMERYLDTRLLIFDLGGGTFDATFLELVDNIFDVVATRGEGFLGGIDFDRAVMNRLLNACYQQHRVDLSKEAIVSQRILSAAENAKIALSREPAVRVHVPTVGVNKQGEWFDLDYVLTREELERITAPLVERTIGSVEEMMAESGIKPGDIDHVIAVGGQTRMPLVRRRIREVLGKEPLTHLNPDTCVAHGAALVAKSGEQITGAVLLDVLSVPIGLVFPGGRTDFIFAANEKLPALKRIPIARPVSTSDLAVGVWQGASLTSSERQVLGVVHMPPHLFSSGDNFTLEFQLSEDLKLSASFNSTTQRHPLALEQTRKRI